MTGFFVTLMLFIGTPLLLGARSRIARLEHRLRLVEEELRRRIVLGNEVLPQEMPHDSLAPAAADVAPVQQQAAELEPEPEVLSAPEPEPEIAAVPIAKNEAIEAVAPASPEEVMVPAPTPAPIPAPVPAAAKIIPAQRITREIAPPPAEPEAAQAEPEAIAEPAPEPAAPRRASVNFEELFGRKLPIWAGGITLAIAGVLIVKYAIDAGFFARVFTRGVQVISGVLFGLCLIGGAEWAHLRREKVNDPRVSQALSGAGISTLYAALLVAANLYHLISPLTAFVGLAVVTGGALWLSLRHGPASALLGLAGGLAAPALTVGLDASVPMLATYLAFTIAGLVGVSRIQRWPWLALLALIGGAGWSLWLVLAGQALTLLGGLSVGTFVLLLAIAMPLFAFQGAAANLLRSVSAIVGAAQLALLVAMGGYQPLHWGLFALIAAAGQWLAWRDKGFAMVPTLSAALSGILLLLWPVPAGSWFALIGLALVAIHALPLLARLWRESAGLQRAVELSAIGAAMPLLTLWHYHAPWGQIDGLGALTAAGGALLALGGAALGWKAPDRAGDWRFALLVTTGGLLLSLVAWLGFAHWQAPLWIGAIAVAVLMVGLRSADSRIEPIAGNFAVLALATLAGTLIEGRWHEALALIGQSDVAAQATSLMRWGGLAVAFACFAWRGERTVTRLSGHFCSAALTYGVIAQLIPAWTLPIGMAGITGLAFAGLRRATSASADAQLLMFGAAAVLLLAITGQNPVTEWQRLSGGGAGVPDGTALLRWLAVAALAVLFAARSRLAGLRALAQAAAALLGYGAAAQVVPTIALPLVPAAGVLGLALWSRNLAWPQLRVASSVLTLVAAGWALSPLALWATAAMTSLIGLPMQVDVADLSAVAVLRRLLIPAVLLGGMLWSLRNAVSRPGLRFAIGGVGVLVLVAVHTLYRQAFAAVFGSDFVAWGLGERLLWCALLLGAAMALWKRGGGMLASHAAPLLAAIVILHLGWYSLLLHNPLWAEQAVGALPLANLLLPLFASVPAALMLMQRMRPDWAARLDHLLQPVLMIMVALFGWASLRHAFHGTLLTQPGVTPVEDILRSILGIALAIGYLLWGIRRKRRIWRLASLVLMLVAVAKVFLLDASALTGLLRIASFVALGFSLIGIGWLYSRQLGREQH